MAPFKLIYASVLVLVSVHIMVLECSPSNCTDCARQKTSCPSSCSCLGSFVDCSRRGLVDVPSDLPYWGKILDLQRNNIGSIADASFSGLSNLTELDLSNNQLRILNSTTFQNLGSLQKLIINHNHLVELPELEKSSPLTLLSLQHNEIHSLSSSVVEGFPKLQILDLSFNHLVDLPANTFGNSSSLLHLTLSHNRLVSVESGLFDNLTALESLKMSKNKLATLPKELFRHLDTLQHLELNSNSLSQIEGLSFQGLSSLVVLKMRHSSVAALQDGAFYGLNSIKKLQLDYNNIGKVTKGWLYGLNSLQRLYINNNNISEIEEDAWDSGRRLLELDLSHNRLQSISSKTFDKLYALKRLLLADNHITYIEEDAFRSLSVLQYLELKNNEVSWTIEDTGKVFAGLGRLKFLGLANNGIRSVVRRAFLGLSRLESLNLTHNDLTTVEEGAFNDLTHLQRLDLNTSSLLCDCRLAWMSGGFRHPVHAKCGYPERLKGVSVFEVPPSQMLCESSPRPVIVREPPTKITLKGENVTLECQARSTSASDPMRFHWRKDGRLLPSPTTRSLSIRQGNHTLATSVLSVGGIRDEDEGRYQCVVSNAFGSVYSGRARITVHVFPVFTKTPQDVSTRAGSTARLECGARGQPRPDVSWQKDGGAEDFPAARERRMHVMPTDDVFFIVGVKPQDSGTYSCTARNVAGTIVANATLSVLEPPHFVRPMEDKEARAGETAVLECLSGGSPRPTLRWSRGDGSPLPPSERHFFTAGDQLLVVVQAQPGDAGDYSCEMTNALGTERGTSRLRVTQVTQQQAFPEDSQAAVTTGVVVIAVVICIVGTSIIWVVIIYHTRKRGEDGGAAATPPPPPNDSMPAHPTPCSANRRTPQVYVDSQSVSGQSKASSSAGTGDSGQQSSDELLGEDDRGLLLHHHHPPPKFPGMPVLYDPEETRISRSSSSASREQVPLLHTFRGGGEKWSRSLSVQQLKTPPCDKQREGEGDSGCSTLPRSATLASVGNWSDTESPRFRRLPKDVPNDSGSFSMVGEEAQELTTRCRSISTLQAPSSRSCTCVTSSSAKT